LLLALLLVGALLLARAPVDDVLGESTRVVYLHGVAVWAALAAFAGAALTGAAAFLLRRESLHRWSAGLGRAAVLLWVSSLVLSLAAMQTSWNGLYLAEPRWQIAARFGAAAVLLQAGLAVLGRPRATSAVNIVFFVMLAAALAGAEDVMHPSSPVFSSDSVALRLSFLGLLTCALAAAALLARALRPHA
jgi:hypothetical protein